MAGTATAINSSKYYLAISTDSGATWETVGELQSGSYSGSMSARDISDKFSGGNKEIAEGQLSHTLSGSGLVTYAVVAAEIKPNNLWDLLTARTKHMVKFTTDALGDFEKSGEAYLTSYTEDSGDVEGNVTYSVEWEFTGAVTSAVVV